jgi:hypothetical protein
MRKTTEMKKSREERMIQFRLVLVASLISTPGVYAGAFSEPSEFLSMGVPASVMGVSASRCFLFAARDRKVGRVMAVAANLQYWVTVKEK